MPSLGIPHAQSWKPPHAVCFAVSKLQGCHLQHKHSLSFPEYFVLLVAGTQVTMINHGASVVSAQLPVPIQLVVL